MQQQDAQNSVLVSISDERNPEIQLSLTIVAVSEIDRATSSYSTNKKSQAIQTN
jgi:hypothetical protein